MATSSKTSAFALGIQSAKGTPAVDFWTTLATVSGLNVRFDREDDIVEHPGVSGNSRATRKVSPSEILGYLVPFRTTFRLRPRFIGAALLAAGFSVATTDVTTHYSHVFTIANADAFGWFTAMQRHGSGGTLFERHAVNSRLSRLAINGDTRQIECEAEGMGLLEGNAATSGLTRTDEATAKMLPTIGTMSALVSSVAVVSRIRSLNLEVTNEFDEDDQAMFEVARADLPLNTTGVAGTLGGIDVDFNTYKKLIRGGTSGTAPVTNTVLGSLAFEYRSAANIVGAAVPYRFAVAMPSVEFYLDDEAFEANGEDQIRFDLQWSMIDNVATPITITLVNDVEEYVA